MKKKNENLTPTQKDVKKPRPVYYDGEKKNADATIARDIISLYVTCKLGYSPIRHIIGDKNDHLVEDVVRQHMLGRKDVKGEKGELYCPGSTTLEEHYVPVVSELAKKYGTLKDPYVVKMLSKGKWHDDPAYAPRIKKCVRCGKELQDDWKACPYCGRMKEAGPQKKLFHKEVVSV